MILLCETFNNNANRLPFLENLANTFSFFKIVKDNEVLKKENISESIVLLHDNDKAVYNFNKIKPSCLILYKGNPITKLSLDMEDNLSIISMVSYSIIEQKLDEALLSFEKSNYSTEVFIEKLIDFDILLEKHLENIINATPDTITDSKEKLRNYLKEKYPDA